MEDANYAFGRGRAEVVIGLFIWARIGDQRQRSFVTGYPGPAARLFRITKTSEAVRVQDAASEWPSAARRRLRGRYHGA